MGKRVTRQFLANIGFCTFIMYTSTCVFTYLYEGVLKGEEEEGMFNLFFLEIFEFRKKKYYLLFSSNS